MRNRSLSKYNINLEPILVSVLIISCFLLSKHLLIPHQREAIQAPLKTETIANNTQNSHNAKELLFFRPMDINSASLEELTLLPGIGEVNAFRIVQFRQGIGFFLSIDELDSIDSPLNPKLLKAIASYLAVDFDC